MAMYGGKAVMEEEDGEKWAKHYCSIHEILLVGEGDFSFALSLARSFGSASNIVATSLDSYDVVVKNYRHGKSNLEMLEKLGAYILHGIDATTVKLYSNLRMRKFDWIIYNFPHAGFYGREDNVILIKKHRNLVRGFFRNASAMLRPNGEIHVTHKTTAPFSHWNLEELASQSSLLLFKHVDFKKEDYPGYRNKRGDGARCDEPFHLGKCSTFMFIFSSTAKKRTTSKRNLESPDQEPTQVPHLPSHTTHLPNSLHSGSVWTSPCYEVMNEYSTSPQHIDDSPMHLWQQPNSFHLGQRFLNPVLGVEDDGSGSSTSIRNECCRIFREYIDHALESFGEANKGLRCTVEEDLRHGFKRYSAEYPGRPLNHYLKLLEELHHLSNLRLAFLQKLLLENDHEMRLIERENRRSYR